MAEESRLPTEILAKASFRFRGDEYAWRVDDIPSVIAAARGMRLVNIGDQLQFRGPDFTCECYWVEVDSNKATPRDLPFGVRVDQTAEAAREAFDELRRRVDFLAEGRTAFADVLNRYEKEGGNLTEVMSVVWYVSSE
jgi:hypothetical protein